MGLSREARAALRNLSRRGADARAGVAAGAGERAGCQTTEPCPTLAGAAGGGEAATVMMTEARGASNAKAKRELGWEPRYASWRQGFAQGLG